MDAYRIGKFSIQCLRYTPARGFEHGGAILQQGRSAMLLPQRVEDAHRNRWRAWR